MDRTAVLLDEMERALSRLRGVPYPGSPEWRAEVEKTAGVLERGVAGLLELLEEKPDSLPESHSRALRFATVRVAEIQLYHAAQVKAGRSTADLYGALRVVLDLARKAYADEFLTPANATPDYLHREIVRVLASNDATLLGPNYPGPMV